MEVGSFLAIFAGFNLYLDAKLPKHSPAGLNLRQSGYWYKDTPELTIYFVFLDNPGVQTNLQLKLCGIAQNNGKYIKQVGHYYEQ